MAAPSAAGNQAKPEARVSERTAFLSKSIWNQRATRRGRAGELVFDERFIYAQAIGFAFSVSVSLSLCLIK